MKTLREKGKHTRHAAWRERSSQLGIYYLLAVTLTYGVLFRLVFLFYAQTTNCYPAWEFWLFGWHQKTSLYQTVLACNLGLASLIVIDLVARRKSRTRIKRGEATIYSLLLAYPVGLSVVFYLFYGAMIPISPANIAYEKTVEITLSQRFPSWMELPEGPLGSCPPSPFKVIPWSATRPDSIGAL